LPRDLMFFDSPKFLFLFLPVVVLVYFVLCRRPIDTPAKLWLIVASLFFYGCLDARHLPILLVSCGANYVISLSILRVRHDGRMHARSALIAGIIMNCGMLAYFKYTGFVIADLNVFSEWKNSLLNIALPLGISFFTFSQIAYLVESYRNQIKAHNFTDYILYVTYFPKLISGPIARFGEMMDQFARPHARVPDRANLETGIYLIFIGLFKKIVLADVLASWVNGGFDAAPTLTFFEAWATSLAFTFQLYFDFSGYTDMAIGISLVMNIRLPINFDSPYRALSVRDFWRRWHMTLSRFIWEFIYVPLGGNRTGEYRTYLNLMATFVVCGLWHGAGWTFVFWGFLHGLALVMGRLWKKTGISISKPLAWFLTFNFVNMAWVFFRAASFDDAVKVLKGMSGANGFVLPEQILAMLPDAFRSVIAGEGAVQYLADGTVMGFVEMILIFVFVFFIALLCKNTNQMSVSHKKMAFALTIAFTLQRLFFAQTPSQFIYFRF
jgi:D-alanyl-lipoteichoic acid acyltransferase DltB (MBOAT superfamily)